ncbi:MAG: amino acid ABC transporter substrate-binding protein [Anaerolineae bacterium]|nr:amino acid ABC transporter substrate-binding protein [Anaerolineae bacterium]
MKTRFSRLVTLLLVGALLIVGVTSITAQESELGPITQAVLDRGSLICGGNANVRGFGFLNDAGEYVGFDIDVCRAVAAAVLGDASAVDVRPLAGTERQAAIQSGQVDMMSRNTTWTLSRDVTWGAIFGPTTFFDGQGVGTRVELGVNSIAELDGSSMCVQAGTTTELNIGDYTAANSIDISILTFPDANSTWDAYLSGACESWTTDKSGIASFHISAPDPGEHMILPETISKEPLGPLSPQNDPQFAEIIAWTVFGLINAEEAGITSENIGDFLPADGEADDAYIARVGPNVARILGQGNNDSGSYLGIANDFMVNVISQVGNYGEIYERNLTPIGLARAGSVNDLWTRGGLIYAPPFR